MGELEAQKKSAQVEYLSKSKGMEAQKGNKGDKVEVVDIRGLLVEIPTKARGKVLRGVNKIYKATDKVVFAYME